MIVENVLLTLLGVVVVLLVGGSYVVWLARQLQPAPRRGQPAEDEDAHDALTAEADARAAFHRWEAELNDPSTPESRPGS